MTLSVGHVTRKIVSEMTYNVSSGTLNLTILYYTIKKRGSEVLSIVLANLNRLQ